MSKFRVVCFGDSITGSRPREAYRHAHLKFSDLLQLMLEAHLGMGRAKVLNRGWAGQTSIEAGVRLEQDILGESPDVAIVLIGGNDAAHSDITSAETRDCLHTIYSRPRDSGIKVLALQYHFLPDNVRDKGWHWLVRNNGLIAEVAGTLGIPTLDMQTPFNQASITTPREELVNVEDGVHLNPGGEIVYARAIFTRMLQLGWLTH